MNERIRDLKEQALIWAIETLDPDALNDNEWGVAIDEKFAELIVKECLAQVDKVDTMLDDDKEKTGVAWVGLAIAKHFGVEE